MTEAVALKPKATKTVKPKTPRVKRDSMTIPQRVLLGTLVQNEYASSGMTDSEFSVYVSQKLGRDVAVQTVASYRESFGLTAPARMSPTALRQRIRVLEALLAEHSIAVPA